MCRQSKMKTSVPLLLLRSWRKVNVLHCSCVHTEWEVHANLSLLVFLVSYLSLSYLLWRHSFIDWLVHVKNWIFFLIHLVSHQCWNCRIIDLQSRKVSLFQTLKVKYIFLSFPLSFKQLMSQAILYSFHYIEVSFQTKFSLFWKCLPLVLS